MQTLSKISDPLPLDSVSNKTPSKPADNWIEARRIYMETLFDVLTNLVYETILSIHEDAVRLSEGKTPEQVERTFMDYLAEVKVWSISIINGETQNIVQYYPRFASLLKGVCVSNVMVLSSAQLNRQDAPPGKVRLNIPSCPVFVQALYTNVAARIFNVPNLFRTTGLTGDQLIENKRRAYAEIQAAIDATVRAQIPLPDIIESSMNFKGNNPVITAKPNNPSRRSQMSFHHSPQQQQAPPSPVQRISSTQMAPSEKRMGSSVQAQQAVEATRSLKSVAKPSVVASAANPRASQIAGREPEEKKSANVRVSQINNLIGAVASKQQEKREKEKQESEQKPKKSIPPGRDSVRRDDKVKKRESSASPPDKERKSKISFAAPRPPVHQKKSSTQQQPKKSPTRPSHFHKHTRSEAIEDMVDRLNLSREDSLENSISSSSSTSSSSSE